jgi:hypothetical protein
MCAVHNALGIEQEVFKQGGLLGNGRFRPLGLSISACRARRVRLIRGGTVGCSSYAAPAVDQ